MRQLPAIKPHKLAKALIRAGFTERTTKGSHRVYRHPDGRRTLIAFHPKPLSRIEVKTVLKQAKLTEAELLELL